MPLNHEAVGVEVQAPDKTWDSKDCLLYALGVGAGVQDPTGSELEFTTENSEGITQRALPTMVVTLSGGLGELEGHLGTPNWANLVHGEQAIELHKPLPVEATAKITSRIDAIYDKGKAALVVLKWIAKDATSGDDLFTSSATMFFRGEGGWGGDRGPSSSSVIPEREADRVVHYDTRKDQALLYRLTGDRNPLHSDPKFAAKGGFGAPILHGLCTYGFTGRAILSEVCGGDPDVFKSMSARFSKPVQLGQSLDIHIWEDGDNAYFRTFVGDDVVIDNGSFAKRSS